MQPECSGAIEFQCAIDLEEMEMRSHLYGPVAGIAYRERRHRPIRIEGDRLGTAHVAAHCHVRRCRVDIGSNDWARFCSGHADLLLNAIYWIGVCTVTRRLPSVNTASTCTIGMRSATPSMTSALVSAVLASMVTSSIVLPARAPSRATAEMIATAS